MGNGFTGFFNLDKGGTVYLVCDRLFPDVSVESGVPLYGCITVLLQVPKPKAVQNVTSHPKLGTSYPTPGSI